MTDSLRLEHKQKEHWISLSGKLVNRKRTRVLAVEAAAQAIFTRCAFFAVIAVASITLYMIANGVPAFFMVGIRDILFSAVWKPTADEPSF